MKKEDMEEYGLRYQKILFQCSRCKSLFFINQKQIYNPTNGKWENSPKHVSIKCPMKYQGCQAYAHRVNLYDPEKGEWIVD